MTYKTQSMYLENKIIQTIKKEFDAMNDLNELMEWRNDIDKRWTLENKSVGRMYGKHFKRLRNKWLSQINK